MEFLYEYGLFLAKAITVVAAIVIVVGSIVSMSSRQKGQSRDGIEITRLNDKYDNMRDGLQAVLLSKDELKKKHKLLKKEKKQEKKHPPKDRGNIFVLDFQGDIKGSHVANLREEITAILTMATSDDRVVVKVESGGGVVHAYGLGASQLDRIRTKGIPLTVCVDKVAASGGYLMACVANTVIAAPFAIIGSIGVVAQLPNFNKVLKKHDIEFEQITAGEYKRTLTMFGENTDQGRQKMHEDLELTHTLFKDYVGEHRPNMDIDKVSTGEHWLGSTAIQLGLIDELGTSDDLLLRESEHNEILEISYKAKQNLLQKLTSATAKFSSLIHGSRAERQHLLM
jgi:serine protease SohB